MAKEEESSNNSIKVNMEDIVEYFSGKGAPHPISSEVENLREMMLSYGFDEIQTSQFMELEDVKKLTGPLYPVYKDMLYHLSWYRLQPIPTDPNIEERILKRFPEMDLAELWNVIDTIDEDTSGEQLLISFRNELELENDEAFELVRMLPELVMDVPVPSTQTMRAFMPTSWIPSVEATFDPGSLPLRLFTVAQLFRREPIQDSKHIRTYHVLSFAVVDTDLTLKKGKAIAERIFDGIGIKDVEMVEKRYPFPYFEPGTEMDICGDSIEMGNCGMISHDVLQQWNIEASVFIMDLGIERMLMHKEGYGDIRRLLYPQFHSAWNLTDTEIAQSLKYKRQPTTDAGKEIATSVYRTYKEYREDKDKKRVVAWKGYLADSHHGKTLISEEVYQEKEDAEGVPVQVILKEAKPGMGLSGPGAFNEIYVKNGDIIGVNEEEIEATEEDPDMIPTNINYAKAFSKLVGWKIEKAIDRGHTAKSIKMIDDLEDINLKLDQKTLHYMLSRNKRTEVKGPVFLKFLFKIKK